MEQSLPPIQEEGAKRPTFLTVLCILSFIGTGIMLLASLLGAKQAFTGPSAEEQAMMEQAMQVYAGGDQNSEMMANMAAMMNDPYKTVNWAMGLVGNLLTLTGVILMWRLKKTGFYLYTIAELVPVTVTLILSGMGAMTTGLSMLGLQSLGIVIIALLYALDLAFIIMYAVNLKHMK